MKLLAVKAPGMGTGKNDASLNTDDETLTDYLE